MKKIYISGAITGFPFDEVKTKFDNAAAKLIAEGYDVVSPINNGIPHNFPWENHIAMDVVLLIGCEAVYLLPDWNLSKGATLEKNIAELTGKQMIYEKVPEFVVLKQAISEIMGVSFYEIANNCRERNHVYARMIYAHFCKEQGAAITEIAEEMKRNHSTVIYYLKKYSEDYAYNKQFRIQANKINDLLNNQENGMSP